MFKVSVQVIWKFTWVHMGIWMNAVGLTDCSYQMVRPAAERESRLVTHLYSTKCPHDLMCECVDGNDSDNDDDQLL